MINEEKVRELFNIALCDSKSDDSRVQKQSASYYGWDYIWKEAFWFHIIIPSDMEQNANMGAHMATHISGRATVAVDAYVFRRVYIKLQMYRYYSK